MEREDRTAGQDCYPEDAARCFGCGRLNDAGHRLRTFWDGEGTVARFTPDASHTALPGYVYGGLLASLVDCHGTGSAAAFAGRTAGRKLGEEEVPPGEVPRFVTARLEVDYRRPTPLGPELVLRGRLEERTERKVVVGVTVEARGEVTVEGRVVAVPMPEGMAGGRAGVPE